MVGLVGLVVWGVLCFLLDNCCYLTWLIVGLVDWFGSVDLRFCVLWFVLRYEFVFACCLCCVIRVVWFVVLIVFTTVVWISCSLLALSVAFF